MPFKIQRVARGLGDLLSTFGGQTPTELEDRIRGTLDLTQLYGAQQRSVFALNNGAAAEGTSVALVPSPTNWIVVYGVTFTTIKTATMTALTTLVALRLNSDAFQEITLRSEEGGPFGATETGTHTTAHWMPYPLLCPPNTMVLGRMSILGTDASANVTLGALVGVLG